MARYIDADALKERLYAISVVADDLYGMGINRGLDRAETAIDMMPTADVAPKSEVASIFDKMMEEARAIADRYEKSANEISDFEFERIEFRGCQMGALLVLFKIAELKKKYTGEQI